MQIVCQRDVLRGIIFLPQQDSLARFQIAVQATFSVVSLASLAANTFQGVIHLMGTAFLLVLSAIVPKRLFIAA
jgi:hypothetical protein